MLDTQTIAQPEAAPGTHRRRPRAYLIAPRFQLKYTGLLVGVVFAVLGALGGVIWDISEASAEHARYAARQAEKALKESRTSSELVQAAAIAEAGDNPEFIALLRQDTAKIDQQFERDLTAVKERVASIEHNRKRLLVVFVSTSLVLVVLLCIVGIYLTHKIVGPAHKMKRLLRQVGTGRLAIKNRLRKGDELGDLFDTFLQMTYSLKALQLERLALFDTAIQQAKDSGAAPDVVEHLQRLRAHLASGLGDAHLA